MSTQHYFKASFYALGAAVLAVAVAAASFFILEPKLGMAVDSTFSISQVIGDEISFTLAPGNVSMVGTLNGITGGTANGSTTVAVRTNAANGYNMSIRFATTSYSGGVMVAQNNPGNAIHDYRVTGGEPTYSFDTSSTSAVFGYTVAAPSPFNSDLDTSFTHNTTDTCNTGGSTLNATNTCWMQPLLSNFQIVNRTDPETTGATTTIHFRVHVPNNPTPGLVADTYTATATLTALNNP